MKEVRKTDKNKIALIIICFLLALILVGFSYFVSNSHNKEHADSFCKLMGYDGLVEYEFDVNSRYFFKCGDDVVYYYNWSLVCTKKKPSGKCAKFDILKGFNAVDEVRKNE